MLFFFKYTATTEIYTLSLHDALPILCLSSLSCSRALLAERHAERAQKRPRLLVVARGGDNRDVHPARLVHLVDRKSTRLNSSHANISYAVFCLKKKTNILTLLLEANQ